MAPTSAGRSSAMLRCSNGSRARSYSSLAWRVDQLEALVLERTDAAPSEAFSVERLRIGLALAGAAAPHRVAQADAVHRRCGDAGKVENRRQDIDQLCRAGDAPRADSRCTNDERHAHDALVDEDAVIAFAVFSERFSVVGRENDERAIEQVLTLEGRDQPADLRIREEEFRYVRIRDSANDMAPARRRADARRTSVSRERSVRTRRDPARQQRRR